MRYVTRFAFVTLILGVSLTLTALLPNSGAKSQQQGRTLVRKPWPVEPVKVVAAKTKNKANVEIGRHSMKMTTGSTASRSPSSITPIRPSLR